MVQVTASVLCVFSQVVLIRSMSFSLFTMCSMNAGGSGAGVEAGLYLSVVGLAYASSK